MTVTIYTYKGCDACRKALKYLAARGVEVENKPIRETPPKQAELKAMLGHLDGKMNKLFNTAGGDYRAMKLKDSLPDMSEAEAFALLESNGNLVKRPFLISESFGTVGFKEAVWDELPLS